MKILVTGASGFVGGEVARRAVEAGHDVAALIRNGNAPWGAHLMKGSIESPPWDQIRSFAPEVCLHCAWIATPGVYLDSPENDSLVEASAAFASGLLDCGLRHFIGTGTCFEYAPSPVPLSTNAPPPAANSPYAAAKIRLHGILPELLANKATYSWARIFYAYGPGEHPNRFPSVMFRNFAAGQPVTVRRPMDIVDYIHISDIGAAFLRLAESGAGGDFNVGSGIPVTVGDIASLAARFTGREDLLELHEQSDTTGRVADLTGWKATGWQPLVRLEDGLRGMFEAARG